MAQNNLSKSLQTLIEKKSIFLVIVVLLVFVICAVFLFGDYSAKMAIYQSQLVKKGAKEAQLKELDQTKKELDQLIETLPKSISSDDLISKLDDFAIQNHIETVDVSAKDPQKSEYYLSVGIHMTFKVKDFKDMVLFFYMIETSPYHLKIDSLSVRNNQGSKGTLYCEINIISNQTKI